MPEGQLTWISDEIGEQLRQMFGIDGTRGDAQDEPHPYIGGTCCWVCGLAESYRKHSGIRVTVEQAQP